MHRLQKLSLLNLFSRNISRLKALQSLQQTENLQQKKCRRQKTETLLLRNRCRSHPVRRGLMQQQHRRKAVFL